MNNKLTKSFFVGVDGGGTKTIAAVSDSNGQVLGVGFGGPVNIGLASAIGPGPGVVIVAGTGFTSKGISLDGRRVISPRPQLLLQERQV